jgi:hypothetical protein
MTHEVINDRGGLKNIRSADEFSRDRQQIYNVNRRKKEGFA